MTGALLKKFKWSGSNSNDTFYISFNFLLQILQRRWLPAWPKFSCARMSCFHLITCKLLCYDCLIKWMVSHLKDWMKVARWGIQNAVHCGTITERLVCAVRLQTVDKYQLSVTTISEANVLNWFMLTSCIYVEYNCLFQLSFFFSFFFFLTYVSGLGCRQCEPCSVAACDCTGSEQLVKPD